MKHPKHKAKTVLLVLELLILTLWSCPTTQSFPPCIHARKAGLFGPRCLLYHRGKHRHGSLTPANPCLPVHPWGLGLESSAVKKSGRTGANQPGNGLHRSAVVHVTSPWARLEKVEQVERLTVESEKRPPLCLSKGGSHRLPQQRLPKRWAVSLTPVCPSRSLCAGVTLLQSSSSSTVKQTGSWVSFQSKCSCHCHRVTSEWYN